MNLTAAVAVAAAQLAGNVATTTEPKEDSSTLLLNKSTTINCDKTLDKNTTAAVLNNLALISNDATLSNNNSKQQPAIVLPTRQEGTSALSIAMTVHAPASRAKEALKQRFTKFTTNSTNTQTASSAPKSQMTVLSLLPATMRRTSLHSTVIKATLRKSCSTPAFVIGDVEIVDNTAAQRIGCSLYETTADGERLTLNGNGKIINDNSHKTEAEVDIAPKSCVATTTMTTLAKASADDVQTGAFGCAHYKRRAMFVVSPNFYSHFSFLMLYALLILERRRNL